jgi:FkbM family methyltransferase
MKKNFIVKSDEHLVDIELLVSKIPNVPINGIVHVGAHTAEEFSVFNSINSGSLLLIEANPSICDQLLNKFKDFPNIDIENLAISNKIGDVPFYVHKSRSGSIESSSILPMKDLKEIVTSMTVSDVIKVKTTTLNELLLNNIKYVKNRYDLLVIDIQGAEILALEGATEVLQCFKAIIIEVNVIPMYDSGVTEDRIDEILSGYNFVKSFTVYHELYKNEDRFVAWGESLYLTKES